MKCLTGKGPDAGKDRGQEEKRAKEDEMVGWHHQFNGHEAGQTLGDGEGQGGLEYCSPWSCKESGKTGAWRTMTDSLCYNKKGIQHCRKYYTPIKTSLKFLSKSI